MIASKHQLINKIVKMSWNPSLYLRHGGPRLRPAMDLLAQAAVSVVNL